jgi:xanthine dehydrogenase accessory factor
MASLILIRGGGDLASGVALRLIHAGLRIVITELPQPLAVRRTVAFAEAIYSGEVTIEGITGRAIKDPTDTLRILNVLGKQQIPVLEDPRCTSAQFLHPTVIVDARMTKRSPEPIGYEPLLYIGLGPGFSAGQNCQVVVETQRGHTLGRVYWQGGCEPDTGKPDPVQGRQGERVLRAPADGEFVAHVQLCEHIDAGGLIAEVAGKPIVAAFDGILRGLLHPGLPVTTGLKVGDLDPRDNPAICSLVSDKALAVGGGVLEAILQKPEVRTTLWT